MLLRGLCWGMWGRVTLAWQRFLLSIFISSFSGILHLISHPATLRVGNRTDFKWLPCQRFV